MAGYQSSYAGMANRTPAPRKGFIEWIGRYWFQIFLILLGLHVFFQKDISVNVNMRSLGESSGVDRGGVRVLPASLKGGSAFSTLSLADHLYPSKTRKVASGESAAFFYLLYPKAARADRVPREMLDQELEKSRKLVERFAKVALTERAKYNIPASIIMAQAILASHNGGSALVAEANNYFAIPASGKCKKGACVEVDWNGEKIKVRTFHTAWESFREHSLILRSGAYDSLQAIPLSDYKGWAKGLQGLGFSPDKDYARNLVRIIELLDLDQFDRA